MVDKILALQEIDLFIEIGLRCRHCAIEEPRTDLHLVEHSPSFFTRCTVSPSVSSNEAQLISRFSSVSFGPSFKADSTSLNSSWASSPSLCCSMTMRESWFLLTLLESEFSSNDLKLDMAASGVLDTIPARQRGQYHISSVIDPTYAVTNMILNQLERGGVDDCPPSPTLGAPGPGYMGKRRRSTIYEIPKMPLFLPYPISASLRPSKLDTLPACSSCRCYV
ncbi:uncharacterized protein G2W53_030964 [Senna tora]|uniref:Uncharacterized protein n=1 Tax=Senna tora TaxID=362788 RepID=A0A834WBA4_9FABA|nr:uncharacterized protein G2W53_030964 [Senna tora]